MSRYDIIEQRKKDVGRRIRLVDVIDKENDPVAAGLIGETGTIVSVDGIGNYHVDWDRYDTNIAVLIEDTVEFLDETERTPQYEHRKSATKNRRNTMNESMFTDNEIEYVARNIARHLGMGCGTSLPKDVYNDFIELISNDETRDLFIEDMNIFYHQFFEGKAEIGSRRSKMNEGFFNSLVGTGFPVDSIVKRIQYGAKQLRDDKQGYVTGEVEPMKIVYDEKGKTIIYTGKSNSDLGLVTDRPIRGIEKLKITKYLNDREYKEFWEVFNSTKLGKAIIESSPKFKEEQEKERQARDERNRRDPEYNGKTLAGIVAEYYNNQVWSHNDGTEEKYWRSMMKLVQTFGNDRKFEKAYENEINELSKSMSKVNANIAQIGTYEKFKENLLKKLATKY